VHLGGFAMFRPTKCKSYSILSHLQFTRTKPLKNIGGVFFCIVGKPSMSRILCITFGPKNVSDIELWVENSLKKKKSTKLQKLILKKKI
jgi:hypothetical protein